MLKAEEFLDTQQQGRKPLYEAAFHLTVHFERLHQQPPITAKKCPISSERGQIASHFGRKAVWPWEHAVMQSFLSEVGCPFTEDWLSAPLMWRSYGDPGPNPNWMEG